MELTETHGKMNSKGCWCCGSNSGKETTEEQHRKYKRCHNKHEILGIKKPRWNKKKGINEMSKKHSRVMPWVR